MNKKLLLFAAVAAVVVVGIVVFTRSGEPVPAPEPQESAMPAPDVEPSQFTVSFTDDGFSPRSLVVPAGTAVTFANNASRGMWVASDVHPLHTLYPGTDIKNCGAKSEMFDACRVVNPGERWTFVFGEPGVWGYHNHIQASETGTILVELSK